MGLRAGDIILAVANTDVATPAQFKQAASRAVAQARGKPINMLVQRGEMVQYVLIRGVNP